MESVTPGLLSRSFRWINSAGMPLFFALACSGGSTSTLTSPVQPAAGMVVDHSSTHLGDIPSQYLQAARTNLRIAYQHSSHGSQLITGLEAMKRSVSYEKTNEGYNQGIFLNDYGIDGASDLGNPDRTAFVTATRNLLTRAGGCDRNIVMWSWCGQADGGAADIQTYLDSMAQLEREFPRVKFVYMTGHLVGTGANGNLNLRNEQIRAYCRANGKILFDFADIESHDPDGIINYMSLSGNADCSYVSPGNGTKNWASDWMNTHPDHELTTLANGCDECAHSERLNCILKARAFWHLAARLAGWDGVAQ
jgi:hypothetical protein